MTLHYRLLLVLLGLLSLNIQAQREERLKGIERMPQNDAALHASRSKSNQQVNLPFRDDFSYRSNIPNPNLWEPSDVWVNQTWARNTISLGVASFDGLNRFGRPYSYVGNDSLGDILSSREINLNNAQDSVYLSFYYQAGGWGEFPAPGDDSLTLQFWNGQDSLWESIWRNQYYPNDSFRLVMIYVDPKFYRDDFRFRFQNYGSKAGSLDLWHIDYVELDDQRERSDSILDDIAFTRPFPTLLNNYESIPWWHVNEGFNIQNAFAPSVDLHYRRNYRPSETPPINLGIYEVTYNGNLLQKHATIGPGLASPHPNNEEVEFPLPPVDAPYNQPPLNYLGSINFPDEFEIEAFSTFSGAGGNAIRANDTVYRRQVFKNYYAYDDGSAERAYEVRNNGGGFIVQRYDILVNDTLKGLDIYFQPDVYNLEDQEFTILLMSNQGGLPGSIIYESDSIYQAQYSGGNFYQSYLLDTTIAGPITSGTVFIGIRQQNSEPMNLGYDQNGRNRTSAFYGEIGDMYQSFLAGTIMMRPLFRYIPRDFSLREPLENQSLEIYPNPSDGFIELKLPADLRELENYQLRLYNLQGQLVAQKKVSRSWFIKDLPAGLYLLRLEGAGHKRQWQSKIQIR